LTDYLYLPPRLYKFWKDRIYMRSPYWYRLRLKVKKQHGVTGRVDIHHLTYARIGKPQWYHFVPVIGKWFITGRERLSDLQPVTREEHNRIHGKQEA